MLASLLFLLNFKIIELYLFVITANERTEQANTTEADSQSEERGDLIQFYNSAYVLKMKSFALKYAQSTLDNKVGVLRFILKIVF